MMQKASGEGAILLEVSPPASPDRNTTSVGSQNILYIPSERKGKAPFSLLRVLKAYPFNLPSALALYLRHDGRTPSDLVTAARYRARLEKAIVRLAEAGIVYYYKGSDSLRQWQLQENGLNLIRRMQNSNSPNQAPLGIYSLPRKARPERFRALKLTMKEPTIGEEPRFEIGCEFETYLDDVNDRQVILTYASEEKKPDAPLIFLPYKTRFTAFDRKKANLDTYEKIWENSGLSFRSAVFLTLTTDPKMHESAYHANKHFQTALNRLFSLIQKRLKYRPKYLNVHEFQKNGLLHSHIVIFGLDYLTHQRQLSDDWRKCGQGSIVYVYGLRHNGQKWTWSRARPKDADRGKSVDTYLKKYLKKALFETKELDLYWTFNKRFFSYSRSLRPASAPHIYTGPALSFIGSAPSDMVSVILARRSRHLWSQIRAAEYEASNGPPFAL